MQGQVIAMRLTVQTKKDEDLNFFQIDVTEGGET